MLCQGHIPTVTKKNLPRNTSQPYINTNMKLSILPAMLKKIIMMRITKKIKFLDGQYVAVTNTS